MSDKAEIQAIAQSLGANKLEVLTILGIAFAESNYDFNARGDGGYSWGAFQAERQDGVSHQQQVKTALDRIRKQNGYMNPIWNELGPFVDNSDENIIRLHKASWQVGVTRIQGWIEYLKGTIDSIRSQTSIDDAGIRVQIAGSDRKLTVFDFIEWLVDKKGVNEKAMMGGQELIGEYINKESGNIKIAGAAGWGAGVAILIGLAVWFFFLRK